MILKAISGEKLPIYGNGQNIRDWIFVEDHCSAIDLILERGKIGETYNIGADCEKSNIDVVRSIVRVLDEYRPLSSGKSYEDQISFITDRPGHDFRYALNSSKLRESLGWTPRTNFEEGVKKTVEWYLTHSQWCHEATDKNYQNWLKENYPEERFKAENENLGLPD